MQMTTWKKNYCYTVPGYMRRPYKIYGFAKTQYNLRPGPGVGPVQ